MKLNPTRFAPLLLALLLCFAGVVPASEAAPISPEEQAKAAAAEAQHQERVERFGPKYQSALQAIKDEGTPEQKARLATYDDDLILEVSTILEARYRSEFETKLDDKTARADESIPSLFYGMIAFALAVMGISIFSLMRAKCQSADLAKLRSRVDELSKD